MKLSKRLLRLIEEFKEQNPSLADHEGAKGWCTEASYAFIGLLRENDITCSRWDIVLDGGHDQYLCPEWYPDITSEGHSVVYVEGVIIDWTARQYKAGAPFPLTYRPPKKAMRTEIDDLDPALVSYARY